MRISLSLTLILICLSPLAGQDKNPGKENPQNDSLSYFGLENFVSEEENKVLILIYPGKEGIRSWHQEIALALSKDGAEILISDQRARLLASNQGRVTELEVKSKNNNNSSTLKWIRKNFSDFKIFLLGFDEGVDDVFEAITNFTFIREVFIFTGYPTQVKAAQFSRIQCRINGFFSTNNSEDKRKLDFLKRYLYGNGKKLEAMVFPEASPSFMKSARKEGEIDPDYQAKVKSLSLLRERIFN